MLGEESSRTVSSDANRQRLLTGETVQGRTG
jgi:hypothetical protein